ncbi:helix-turn-helix transcriptional regulator [uncultured Roseovarius sp.]|uniref:helix-turn-helix transcriptional regulator n=1 Tax=uncultured Roseovarius sp. TaxID=293344 RepID=UPI00343421F1
MTLRTKDSEKEHFRAKSVVAGLALAGTVSLEMAADHLGISSRTLQRRLNRRGISFWALVEQSRFEIAAALLCDTDLKIHAIATRLGYSSPNGFSRAFARWAGCSPSAFRALSAGPHYGKQIGAKWAEETPAQT